MNKKTLSFSYNWQTTDDRPRVIACAITGKTAWIQVEFKGVIFNGTVCKALVKQLRRLA